MSYVSCALCLCAVFSVGRSTDNKPSLVSINTHDTSSPMEFPNKSDSSTPILIGDNPKSSNLPPKVFPTKLPEQSATGASLINGSDINASEIKLNQDVKLNLTNGKMLETVNSTLSENVTKTEGLKKSEHPKDEEAAEQEDMLHSKYKGGQDVDELLKPEKKASEKDEKKLLTPKKDPKTEVLVSSDLDKKGPKLLNETKTKSGESMLESTSKMMAVSSSVLANTQTKHHGIIEPAKTVATVLLSIAVIMCFGVIGLLVWKKISMRRFGRDVLINEDDFDEIADMHTFDRAQIHIT